jgi:hypothetical protein
MRRFTLPILGSYPHSSPTFLVPRLRYLSRHIFLLWLRTYPRHVPIVYMFDFIEYLWLNGSIKKRTSPQAKPMQQKQRELFAKSMMD